MQSIIEGFDTICTAMAHFTFVQNYFEFSDYLRHVTELFAVPEIFTVC